MARKKATLTPTYTNLLMEVDGEPEIEIVNGVKQYTIWYSLHQNQIKNTNENEEGTIRRTGELPTHHQ